MSDTTHAYTETEVTVDQLRVGDTIRFPLGRPTDTYTVTEAITQEDGSILHRYHSDVSDTEQTGLWHRPEDIVVFRRDAVDTPRVVVEGELHQIIYSSTSGCHGHNSLYGMTVNGELKGGPEVGHYFTNPFGRVLPTGTKVRITYEIVEESDEPLRTNSWHRTNPLIRGARCVCKDEVEEES